MEQVNVYLLFDSNDKFLEVITRQGLDEDIYVQIPELNVPSTTQTVWGFEVKRESITDCYEAIGNYLAWNSHTSFAFSVRTLGASEAIIWSVSDE